MMGNLYKYFRNVMLFAGLAAIVAVARWLLTTRVVRDNLGSWEVWLWPVLLGFGTVIGYRALQVSKEPVVAPLRAVAGVLLIVALYALRSFFAGQTPLLPTVSVSWLAFVAEEAFFRWIGLETLRQSEEPLYRDPYLKRLAPLSFLTLTVIYILMQELTPAAGSRFVVGIDRFLILNCLYLLTGSIWPTAVASCLFAWR